MVSVSVNGQCRWCCHWQSLSSHTHKATANQNQRKPVVTTRQINQAHSEHEKLTQCGGDLRPASQTVGRHKGSIGSVHIKCLLDFVDKTWQCGNQSATSITRHPAVTANLKSKQLLLFVFEYCHFSCKGKRDSSNQITAHHNVVQATCLCYILYQCYMLGIHYWNMTCVN